MKGITHAQQHGAEHVIEQAKTLARATLEIDPVMLEREVADLIERKRALRGGTLEVKPVTPDHLAHAYAPPSHTHPRADFGDSILN